MGRYLQESYDKALREVERLREERDALAALLEQIREAFLPGTDGGRLLAIGYVLNQSPITSLARRNALLKAVAMHEAICDLESEFDPCHPLIERLEAKEAEYRRQAEEAR